MYEEEGAGTGEGEGEEEEIEEEEFDIEAEEEEEAEAEAEEQKQEQAFLLFSSQGLTGYFRLPWRALFSSLFEFSFYVKLDFLSLPFLSLFLFSLYVAAAHQGTLGGKQYSFSGLKAHAPSGENA
ncbi:hypothetical protein Efla_006962 [Eimeria flavescens]